METRVETLAELKKIRFGQYGTIFCKETEREYYFEPNGGSLTPDDLDVVMAAQGGNARLVAHKAYSTGGGGGGVSDASNVGPVSSKRVFRDKTGTILNFRRLTAGTGVTLTENADDIVIASLGGGGAYPDVFKTVDVDTTLTLADQGIIFLAGGRATLPAVAPDGTTFKFGGAPNDLLINTNGNLVVGIGVGDVRLPFACTLIAGNVPALVWVVFNKRDINNYYSDATYLTGDIVTYAGGHFLSINNNNIGNIPDDAPGSWLVLRHTKTGTIAFSDLSFVAGTAPTGGTGSYRISRSGNVRVLDITIQLFGASVSVTECFLTLSKSVEIRDAIGTGASEDFFGTGHVATMSGFASAQPLSAAIYSPTNLQYIKAKFPATNNVAEIRMQFVFG